MTPIFACTKFVRKIYFWVVVSFFFLVLFITGTVARPGTESVVCLLTWNTYHRTSHFLTPCPPPIHLPLMRCMHMRASVCVALIRFRLCERREIDGSAKANLYKCRFPADMFGDALSVSWRSIHSTCFINCLQQSLTVPHASELFGNFMLILQVKWSVYQFYLSHSKSSTTNQLVLIPIFLDGVHWYNTMGHTHTHSLAHSHTLYLRKAKNCAYCADGDREKIPSLISHQNVPLYSEHSSEWEKVQSKNSRKQCELRKTIENGCRAVCVRRVAYMRLRFSDSVKTKFSPYQSHTRRQPTGT